MTSLPRRHFLRSLSALTALPALRIHGREKSAPDLRKSERKRLADMMDRFCEAQKLPGLTLAIAVGGEPAFEHAVGWADLEKKTPMTPDTLCRIASVSKPITSVAVFCLIRDGKLRLEDRIFGPGGVLGDDFGPVGSAETKEITLHHLLTHTSGAWANDGNDPMFRDPAWSQQELITRTLAERPLTTAPGKKYAYSNFGYCVLGRVIEKISGQSYVDFVQKQVLEPAGATDMLIGESAKENRHPNEAVYAGNGDDNPYGFNVPRMDAHGGWIATARDVTRFATHTDGFSGPKDLLGEKLIREMVRPTKENEGYACGWAVNKAPNWWHNGSLPGTSAIMVRTASGLCWTALTNIRRPELGNKLDAFVWDVVKAVPDWKA